ncbi:MAG: SAM-dependent methyltransferase [Firmicutes bacterium HGW-Firmicutes-11]|nr:MAG: SAM-dependent methyltransferase [Firmicutes bacterium HGW-Firmicutes-11]
MALILEEGERLDATGFGTVTIIQKPTEFCYGIDAVLLADFASGKPAKRIADLGTGNGILPLLLSYKFPKARLVGLEIQEEAGSRATRSVACNQLEDRITILHGDVRDGLSLLPPGEFDAVIANPPYNNGFSGIPGENDALKLARHEITGGLSDFIRTASGLLRSKGHFYMIHRPSRLVDIFCLCREHRLEPKRIRLIAPRQGKPPNLVLVHCCKDGGIELRIEDTLYVHKSEGGYTREIEEIYERKQV